MAGSGHFVWEVNTITPKLQKARATIGGRITTATKYYALTSEREAKLGARWTDRTGNARGGLTGIARSTGAALPVSHFEIILYSKMSYGIWLEIRWGGKYSIIKPTLTRQAPAYFEAVAGVIKAAL